MKSTIEIFRTGSHTDMGGKTITVSRDELVAMAAAYDPAVHEAPIVLGHPKHNDPAMGWVKGLHVSDSDTLVAELHEINPGFSELVDQGSYKKISASLYPPGAKGNPAGDNYGLRHVGFLGGAVPAIKGLKSVQFADDAAEASVFISDFGEQGFLFRSIASAFRSLRDYLIEDKGTDIADKALPSYLIDTLAENSMTIDAPEKAVFAEKKDSFIQPQSPALTLRLPRNYARRPLGLASPEKGSESEPPLAKQGQAPARADARRGSPHGAGDVPPSLKQKEPEMDKDQKDQAADFAEREAALKAREDEVTRKAADFAGQQQKILEGENAAFVEAQIKAGKLASGWKDKILAFMNNIDAAEVVSFGEGEQKSALELFKDMFIAAKPVVDFGEHSADDGKGGANPETYEEFLEPALAFKEEQKNKGIDIDIGKAVDHIRKGTSK